MQSKKYLKEKHFRKAGLSTDIIQVIEHLFEDYDEDKNGVLDFDEFSKLLKCVYHDMGIEQLDEEGVKEIMKKWNGNCQNLFTLKQLVAFLSPLIEEGLIEVKRYAHK